MTFIKNKSALLPKALTVTGLTLIASLFSGGILWVSMTANADPTTIADINNSFGRKHGLQNLTQNQETNQTGMGSTTISFNINGNDNINENLDRYQKAVNDVADGETINTNITLKTITNNTVNVKYYASSPSDYVNGEFNKAIRVVDGFNKTTMTNVDVEIQPTLSGGRSLNVNGSTNNIDTHNYNDYQNLHTELARVVSTPFGVDSKELYTVSYSNIMTADDAKAPSFTVTTMFDTQQTLDTALRMDTDIWRTINLLAFSPTYSKMKITDLEYLSTQRDKQSKLMITVPDEGPEELDKKVNILKSVGALNDDFINVPAPYNITFRYDTEGPDVKTIYGYYNNK